MYDHAMTVTESGRAAIIVMVPRSPGVDSFPHRERPAPPPRQKLPQVVRQRGGELVAKTPQAFAPDDDDRALEHQHVKAHLRRGRELRDPAGHELRRTWDGHGRQIVTSRRWNTRQKGIGYASRERGHSGLVALIRVQRDVHRLNSGRWRRLGPKELPRGCEERKRGD